MCTWYFPRYNLKYIRVIEIRLAQKLTIADKFCTLSAEIFLENSQYCKGKFKNLFVVKITHFCRR